MVDFSEGHFPTPRRKLNVFVLAMLSLAVVISLRNLPVTAQYGFSSLFYYLIATVFFLIPYSLVSAELASGWPKGGGIYAWVREALGERWGFFTIWLQWFHSIPWFPVMLSFIGAGIAYLFNPELANHKNFLIGVILVGFWGVTFLNYLGIKTSAFLTTACVILGTILPGLVLISLATQWFMKGNPIAIEFSADSFFPKLGDPTNLVFLAGVFLALCGLEANANLAREVKNPQKNYPKAILIAALFTLGILVLGSMAIAVVIPKEQISFTSGLLDAFASFLRVNHLGWMIAPVAVLIILGAFGELNAWTLTGAKGLFATSEHGSLPPVFHRMNRHESPVNILLLQAILVTFAAFVFLIFPSVNVAFWVLSALSVQLYLMTYVFLFIAAVVLRYTKPKVHRAYRVPFKNPGMWVMAVLGMVSTVFALFISFLPPREFEIKNVLLYETFLIGTFVVSCLIPLILFARRKPHWKNVVLAEIREEIHRRTH